jgi:hypothetical protein
MYLFGNKVIKQKWSQSNFIKRSTQAEIRVLKGAEDYMLHIFQKNIKF